MAAGRLSCVLNNLISVANEEQNRSGRRQQPSLPPEQLGTPVSPGSAVPTSQGVSQFTQVPSVYQTSYQYPQYQPGPPYGAPYPQQAPFYLQQPTVSQATQYPPAPQYQILPSVPQAQYLPVPIQPGVQYPPPGFQYLPVSAPPATQYPPPPPGFQYVPVSQAAQSPPVSSVPQNVLASQAPTAASVAPGLTTPQVLPASAVAAGPTAPPGSSATPDPPAPPGTSGSPAKPGKVAAPVPPVAPATKERQPGEPYDPIAHRHVEHPNSVMSSIINLLKSCLGTGILAMPSAFKNAGLALGTFGIVFAGVIVTHAIHILVRTAQQACVVAEQPSMSFAETCGAAFTYGPKRLQFLGTFMQRFADVCLTLCYVGVLCIYVVFIAASFKEVFDELVPGHQLSIKMYCLIFLIPLALICQIRSLNYVVPFSAAANIGIFVVLAITLAYTMTDLPSPKERSMVAPPSHWPRFISIAVFAIEGIGVVMPVENEMARPDKFLGCPGVLNVTMTFVVVLYGFVGFFGYLKYGDHVRGSITLNLPKTGIISPLTKLLMALVIFLTYTLQFYVPMEAITRRLRLHDYHRHQNLIQIGIRTAVVSFTVMIAALVPNLELVISLVGAIFFSTCGCLLPPVVETVYRWDRDLGPHNYIVWKNAFLFLVGVLTLVAGSLTVITENFH